MARFGKRELGEVELEQRQVESLLGLSMTQIALGMSVLALFAAVFFTPILDQNSNQIARNQIDLPGDIDRTVTGSVEKSSEPKRYIIRRSITNPNPELPCYIYEDGTREGNC